MNPFLLSATERFAHWRQFRASLPALPDAAKMAAVAGYWANTPLSIVDDPPRWPTIWQMMRDNIWSRNSVAIGMEATLRLADMAAHRMTLRCIKMTKGVLLVLVVDDTWLLNYDWGSFRLYSTVDHETIGRWRFIDKDYLTLDG